MQDKVQTLLRLSDSERSHQRSSNQVENLKKQNQDLSHRLSQATQEKVNALMRVAADGNSSQAAGTAKGMPSPGKTSTWKVCTCSSVVLVCQPYLHVHLHQVITKTLFLLAIVLMLKSCKLQGDMYT